tara:strand:+ start:160 stop:768 length:609 start_codon:yes stop_codon:yes gene_type:complete
MYKLTYSPASPYVRKVRLAGYLSGLNDQIELLNPDHETYIKMKLNNPLGKIPVLMTPNNQYVFDSRVIVELLNETSGKLYPNDDNKKIILTNAALTEGLVDASLLYVYSIRYAGDQKPSEVWQKLQLTKIENTIDYLDKNVSNDFNPSKVYISHIGLIVALDYLNFRKIYDWEMKTKNLDAWHKQVSASMPGYKETYPKDPS